MKEERKKEDENRILSRLEREATKINTSTLFQHRTSQIEFEVLIKKNLKKYTAEQ